MMMVRIEAVLMRATQIAALVALVSPACARTGLDAPGMSDTLASNGADTSAPTGDASDTSIDMGPTEDATDRSCPWTASTVGRIDAWASGARQPLVAGGRVFVHERSDAVVRSVGVSPESGERTPLTPDGVESAMIDAAGDTVVWLENRGAAMTQFALRAAFDGATFDGSTSFTRTGTDISLPTTSRQAAADFAAFVDEDASALEVLTATGSLVSSTARRVQFATAGDGLVAWTEATERGPSRLYAARIGDGSFAPIDLGDVSQFRPEIAIADGAVFAVGLDESALRIGLDRGLTRIDDGPCNLPVAGGGAVVFTCGDAPLIGWFNLGERLLWVRGDERDEIVAGGGRLLGAARVFGDAVVWVSFDSLDDGDGLIELWTPGIGVAPEPVAPTGAGCYSCGAYWPPPSLSIERGLAAWNYADPQPDNFDPPQAIGWARLERRCL